MDAPPESQDKYSVDSHSLQKNASIDNDSRIDTDSPTGNKSNTKIKKQKKPRTRVSKACKSCARLKVKCDGSVPCMPCLLRGRSCQAKVDNKIKLNLIGANVGALWTNPLRISDKEMLLGLPEFDDNSLSPSSAFSSERQASPPEHENGMNSDTDSAPHIDAPVVNQAEWDSCIESFCRDTLSRYPFLHLPTLRSRYAEISGVSPFSPRFNFQSEERRAQISQIFICLAIGKFCESSYADSAKGSYPGGWGLYSAAVHIHGDFLTSGQGCSYPTLVPQTVVLMVIYLCYVDATELAKRLLSLAISQLYCMGCHQSANLNRMPVFKDELLRRLWCCVYTLERELGLQTEGSFLIQDSNVDFVLPRNLSDLWLSSYREDTRSSSDIRLKIEEEIAKNHVVTASHVKDTTWHARTASRIWGALHHMSAAKSEISSILIESLEYSTQQAEKMAKIWTQVVEQQQKPCWHEDRALETKHQTLMRIKWRHLRLLISRTVLRQSQDLQVSDSPDKDGTKFTCLHLIDEILRALEELPNEYPKFSFPYLHFWITAVDLGLELVAEDSLLRECYGSTIFKGLISLRELCSRTWMSTRMTRKILSMSQMSRSSFSNQIESGNAALGWSSLQKSEVPKNTPETPVSPIDFMMPADGERQRSLHDDLPFLNNISTPRDISSANMVDCFIDSTAYTKIDALHTPTSLSQPPPIIHPTDTNFQITDCLIRSDKPPLDHYKVCLSNALNYGVSEIGLDGAALHALSDADISPLEGPCQLAMK